MKQVSHACAIVTVVISIFSSTLLSAAPIGEPKVIRGRIVDAEKKAPLEYANVVLKNSADSSLVRATVSGKTGEFILPNIPSGKYYLRVSFIGYEERMVKEINIGESEPGVNLGTLALSETALQVEEMTVEAQRPTEEFHLDKKVINVSGSPQATGGTALDVLRNQPSVRVDATDNVTLRGSSTFTVLVNGRPSVFQGADALKQIPANMIDNIELITNPSAKYDAEGAAGIININLKQQAQYETKAIVNTTAGTRDKYSGDISITHSLGPVNINGGFDYRDNTYWQLQQIERSSFLSAGDITNNTDVNRRDNRRQYNARLGAEYNIDPSNVISLTGSIGEVNMERRFIMKVHNFDAQADDYTYIHNDFDLSAPYTNAVFSYTHRFEPKISELSIENNFTTVELPFTQNTDEFATDPSFQNRSATPIREDFTTDNSRYENTAKIDYFYQISPQSKFEMGAQTRISMRKYDVANQLFDWDANQWITDPSLTNKYDFKNDVHAGYATYSNSVLDFGFQVGLRAEYMDRLLEQQTLGEDYQYDKLDWFPSASVSRKFGENQLQFSYSRRVNRPNEVTLNPFPYYSDSYFTSAGNPELLPEYINSYELNYQRLFGQTFFSVQTYLRRSTDAMWQSQFVDDNGVLTTTFGNFAETSSLGVEISSSYPLTKWLRLDPNVNLFNYTLKGDVFGNSIETDDFTWTARLNATITASPSTLFQLTGFYMSEQVRPQSEVDPRLYVSVVARQHLFERAFTVTLSGSNLFTSSYYEVNALGENFQNYFLIKPEVPMFNLTLTYNFNNYRQRPRGTDVDVNVGG